MLLEGIFLPLTTPFHPDGRLYLHKLEHNVRRYSKSPAAGMVVLGASGEAGGLSDAEQREVLAAAIGAAEDEKVMIAGVGRASVVATLEMAERAARLGYDAVAVGVPAFAGEESMRAELVGYFLAIADRAGLPLVLGAGLPVDAVSELAGHPGVTGMIAGDEVAEVVAATAGVVREVVVTTVFGAVTERMQRVGSGLVSAESLAGGAVVAAGRPAVKTRVKRVGFQVLCGNATGMLAGWDAGAVGAVPRLGTAAPQACCEVWQAYRDGDQGLAEEKQERILGAAARMHGWRGVAALKYGCDLNGYFGGRARLPILPLTGEERRTVEEALAGLGN